MRRHSSITAAVLAFLLVSGLAAYSAHVPTGLTVEDREALARVLQGVEIPRNTSQLSWSEEVTLIESIQRRVLETAPENKGIPKNRGREPADLVELGHGLCYDRSRVIEKALVYAGFEVRHLAAYALEDSKLGALVTPGHPSHALSEVLTSRGWMLVDSNSNYLGVDSNLEPMSAADVSCFGRLNRDGIVDPLRTTLGDEFFFVYGLYSRHGRFYPPYVPVPELNLGQFLDNFSSAACLDEGAA